MRMYDIIAKKRDGGTLDHEELSFAVNGYVAGDVPDYQMSALLMAIYLRGMTDEETAMLTDVMAHSGDMVDLSAIAGIKPTSTPPAASVTRRRWSLRPSWRPAVSRSPR